MYMWVNVIMTICITDIIVFIICVGLFDSCLSICFVEFNLLTWMIGYDVCFVWTYAIR